jgi:hypothetical protein
MPDPIAAAMATAETANPKAAGNFLSQAISIGEIAGGCGFRPGRQALVRFSDSIAEGSSRIQGFDSPFLSGPIP